MFFTANKKLIFVLIMLFMTSLCAGFCFLNFQTKPAQAADESADKALYEKYVKYLRYKKYRQYLAVKKYEDYGKYKDEYKKYKLYKENHSKYAKYKKYRDEYKKYQQYRDLYKPLAAYSKYSGYNKSVYAGYGGAEYKAGYERYLKILKEKAKGNLGPNIKVGVFSFTKDEIKGDFIEVECSHSYTIKSGSSTVGTVPAGEDVEIDYKFGSALYDVESEGIDWKGEDYLVITPTSSDKSYCTVGESASYRGKIIIKYCSADKKIWVINEVPMEHYVWGLGEASNGSPEEYLKTMAVIFRTYGYWKIKYGTAYNDQGFDVTDTGSSQVYGGYNREQKQPRIVSAAESTRGKIVKYKDKIALTPYSSGTDGRTRSFKQKWGSDKYPWCQSVKDPLGKIKDAKTRPGNHMVGLSATGAYNFALKKDWSYSKIIKYYYTGVSITSEY